MRLTWLTRNPDALGNDVADDLDFVVLGSHLDHAQLLVVDRMVRPVVSEPQPGRVRARRPADDLVTEADAEQRPAVVDDRLRQGHGAIESSRIPWAWRQDQAVDVRSEGDRRRDRVRQDADPGAAMAHGADDVGFQSEVDDPDQRAAVLRTTHVHDRRRRDVADEVLILPARHGAGARDGRLGIDRAGSRHDPAQRAVRPQVTGKSTGVDAGDGRDVGIAQERGQLARVLEHGRGRVGDDQRPQPRPDRLVVVDQAAIVADEGIGHDHDLAGVGRVGADLLVAGLAGVDDEVAAGRDRRAEGHSREDRPILERQQRRTQVADPRIDDRARSGCRGHGSGDHVAPDTTNPPASRARWAGACADIDASFAGLTGPVRQPHRTGHERTTSG